MFIEANPKETAIEQLDNAYLLDALAKATKEIVSLCIENEAAIEELGSQKEEIRSLKEEIARLKEQLALAKNHRFGKKKESGDIIIQPEVLPESGLPESPPLVPVAAHTRKAPGKKQGGRPLGTSHLPKFQIHHDIKDEDKQCSCCQGALHLVGKDTSEQLELLPQRFYVAEHIRYKYSCRHCEKIRMGPKEPAPIPKALAGPSLLTEVIINKYHAHLPLYRQSKLIENLGVHIPDNTLGNWVMAVGEALMPLYPALWADLKKQRYLQVDETPVKLQKPDKKAYLWCYLAPWVSLVIFEMSLTRQCEVVETRLGVEPELLLMTALPKNGVPLKGKIYL